MATSKKPGELHVGEQIHADSGDRDGTPILLDSADFTTHGVIVGMTGSGKTGLGIVLLEEALLSGVPVLAIDPKGDLGNLALTFPDLDATSFEPWMDEGDARVKNTTTAELAQATAELWKKGLAGWGLDGSNIKSLAQAADPVIYTPGAASGVPLDVLGRLDPPATDDPAARQDEVDSTVSGLLGLIGVESDPLSGREHILLANLIARSWDAGTPLDMPTLLGQLMDPPIRKLGVLDLDTFFPAKDRQALVMRLNGLLASPSFAAWATGAPMDPQSMLWDDQGNARAAVVSLRHLDENERHFAITVLLSRVISWMRSQSGTSQLRCLIYIDEVMGLAPPVGNPSTKKPILTLLKQARAFGVGLVLSTQNPVDLDYKAISNAGTWMIGRLQTEQDKNRLIDGLRSADGSIDIGEVEDRISQLGKRQFMLRTTRSSALPLFTTRWAMSYLAGPMSRSQVTELMADKNAELAQGAPSTDSKVTTPAPAGGPPAVDPIADDESTVAPNVPSGTAVRYVAANAPWLEAVGGVPGSNRYAPVLAARVSLLFDDTRAKLRHTEEWEAIVPTDIDGFDADALLEVDFDDRDFSPDPPEGIRYVVPEFNFTKTALTAAQRTIKNALYNDESLALFQNTELKLFSRPNETRDAFELRCRLVADDGNDAAAGKLRDKLESQLGRIHDQIAKAEDRVRQAEIDAEGRKHEQIIDLGTSILGGLLGGRRRSRSLGSAARRMGSGRRRAATSQNRVETAMNRLDEKYSDLQELEAKLAESILDLEDEWNEKAEAITELDVSLEKADITIDDLIVAWIPVG
ncbi:MAG: ATP-binding protein [Acidimicrobiales bacterium]